MTEELFGKIYVDACLSPFLRSLLAKDRFDAIAACDVGMSDADDVDHLIYAASKNRILVTGDKADFVKLVKQVPKHAGIIICNQRSINAYTKLAKRIEEKLNTYTADEFKELVLWVA